MTKVYVLYAEEYGGRWVIGVFSSLEKVKEVWKKWYNERNPDTDLSNMKDRWWVDDEDWAIVEYELDQVKVSD